jgi:hypothetical protein
MDFIGRVSAINWRMICASRDWKVVDDELLLAVKTASNIVDWFACGQPTDERFARAQSLWPKAGVPARIKKKLAAIHWLRVFLI